VVGLQRVVLVNARVLLAPLVERLALALPELVAAHMVHQLGERMSVVQSSL